MNTLRVGVYAVGSERWLGGVFYIEHLLRSLRGLGDDKRPRVCLIINDAVLDSPELHAGCIGLADSVMYFGGNQDAARRVGGPDCICVSNDLAFYRWVDFTYPDLSRSAGAGPTASWIPDFQHLHLPEFFSESERLIRSDTFAAIAQNASHLVLSSENALADYRRFFPDANAKPFVLHFYGRASEDMLAGDPAAVQRAYALPERFLICCNQFWAHKNHLQLFEAVALLRQRRIDVPVVCTGPTFDNRWPDYFDALRRRVDELGIGDLVHILGTIPRHEQLQLMRRSLALVQPSLFEGWSTVIEDGRCVGKTMLLSDTPIHREQAPDGSLFFPTGDPAGLAAMIEASIERFSPGPDRQTEQNAARESELRAQVFARDFLLLAQAVVGGQQTATVPPDTVPAAAAKEDPESLCNRGEQCFGDGDPDTAKELFHAALCEDPCHARTLNNLGVLSWNGGDPARAANLFRMAAASNPFDATSSLNLGEALTAADIQAAKKVYLDFLIRSPDHPLILKALRDLPPEAADRPGDARGTLPRPTKDSLLERLKRLDVSIDVVIDVGVHESGTPELIRAFPDAKHWLFEPVNLFQESIRRLYAGVDHELVHAACADERGECFQIYTSQHGDGRITHSELSGEYVAPGSRPGVVDCKPVRKILLDDVTAPLRGNILLKVDVDGFDLQVLRGATRTLRNTSLVIVEATVGSWLERARFLDGHGFDLFDIVDLNYYGAALYQFDLVFVSRALKQRHGKLSPWAHNGFQPDQWHPVIW